MSRGRTVPHFQQVDRQKIQSCFIDGRSHRAYLQIPFLGRNDGRTLCVIGQNPSAADEREADKTVRYLEELVFKRLPDYGRLIVLNLYSKVDTTKEEASPPLHPECAMHFDRIVKEETDFLVVFGQLKNQGRYRFRERALEIQPKLRSKYVFKIEVDTKFAPHPGNKAIFYHNFNVGFAPYDFADLTETK